MLLGSLLMKVMQIEIKHTPTSSGYWEWLLIYGNRRNYFMTEAEAQKAASVLRGIQDVANGNVSSLGTFAQYADIEIDD